MKNLDEANLQTGVNEQIENEIYISENTSGSVQSVWGGFIIYDADTGAQSNIKRTIKELREYTELCLARGFDPIERS